MPAKAALRITIRATVRRSPAPYAASASSWTRSRSSSFAWRKRAISPLRTALDSALMSRPLRARMIASFALPAQRSAIRSCSAMLRRSASRPSACVRARSAASASAAEASSYDSRKLGFWVCA